MCFLDGSSAGKFKLPTMGIWPRIHSYQDLSALVHHCGTRGANHVHPVLAPPGRISRGGLGRHIRMRWHTPLSDSQATTELAHVRRAAGDRGHVRAPKRSRFRISAGGGRAVTPDAHGGVELQRALEPAARYTPRTRRGKADRARAVGPDVGGQALPEPIRSVAPAPSVIATCHGWMLHQDRVPLGELEDRFDHRVRHQLGQERRQLLVDPCSRRSVGSAVGRIVSVARRLPLSRTRRPEPHAGRRLPCPASYGSGYRRGEF